MIFERTQPLAPNMSCDVGQMEEIGNRIERQRHQPYQKEQVELNFYIDKFMAESAVKL